MEQNLHALFDRALAGEPVPPPGDLAGDAMVQGTRLRRRRRLLTGGATAGALGVATVAALQLGAPGAAPAPAGPLVRAADRPGCTTPVRNDATDVSIFLSGDVTGDQRQEVAGLLARDPAVRAWTHADTTGAYDDFSRLWRDEPGDLPESFRVTMADPDDYPAFRDEVAAMPGVDDVIGSRCR